MRREILIILSAALSFLLELSFESAGWFSFPFLAAVLIFWFWRLRLATRFFWGAAAGLLADTVSLFPFGTHLLVFIIIGFSVEFLQRIFSDIQSPLVQGISVGILLVIFLILTPTVAMIFRMA